MLSAQTGYSKADAKMFSRHPTINPDALVPFQLNQNKVSVYHPNILRSPSREIPTGP